MPEQALVVLEVEDELRYLFEAPSLPDVQGAAALLETLNRFTLPTLVRQRDYQGAGIAWGGHRYVATFPNADVARRFLADARGVYRQRMVAAGALGTAVPTDSEELVARFGDVLQRARRQLMVEQATTPATIAARYSPELRWCDACRALPAHRRRDGALLCRACVARRGQLADQAARLAVPGYQASLADASEEDLAARPVWERFVRWARDRGLRRTGEPAADVATLTSVRVHDPCALADSAGWLAVVIARVNDLGQVLALFDDSQRALRASARVNRLFADTLFEVVAGLLWHGQPPALQGDVLLVGGDRLVGVFPADRAPALVARCLRGIEGQSAAAIEGRRVSLSAGIGLVPAGLPLGVAATAAQRALAAARAAYVAEAGVARGQWRSAVAIDGPGLAPMPVLNVGELERSLSHARTLGRIGLRADQVRRLAAAQTHPAGSSEPRMVRATVAFNDMQRRATAAVLRDLGTSGDSVGPPGIARLLEAIACLIPFAAPLPVSRVPDGGATEAPRSDAELRSA